MTVSQDTFDGLAFPVITVRLGNGRGTATMTDVNGDKRRATLGYSYSERDGATFALKVARKLWDAHVERMSADKVAPYDDTEARIFIPGDLPAGYTFTVIPARFFA